MDLELFTPETCPTIKRNFRGLTPFLSCNNTGLFHISSRAAEKMQLGDGDTVIISQDPANKSDWYIGPGDKKTKGFPLRRLKSQATAVQFNSSTLAAKMREALDLKESSPFKMIIAGQPTRDKKSWITFYGLLLKPTI